MPAWVEPLARRPYLAPALLAVFMAVVTVLVAAVAGLPIKDPDGIFGERARLLLGTMFVFMALDIVPRAIRRARWQALRVPREALAVSRERWTRRRAALAISGIVSFYITYVAYRNLKSYLPSLVDQNLDGALLEFERSLSFGVDPAVIMHQVLGTGAAAHVLSTSYLLYLAFVPISVAAALIWSSRMRPGFWYATALGLNWTLGVLGYYLVPALGPAFVVPWEFDQLPVTGVLGLQQILIEERGLILLDPIHTIGVQSVAAFPSLHVSVVFTAALIAHHLDLRRALRWLMWAFLGLTLLSTVYFGWHYVIDDIAGLAVGAAAVYGAALVTGQPIHRRGGSRDDEYDVIGGDHREDDRVDAVERSAVGSQ